MPARVSPPRLGGHRRLEAGQERRSKEGAHGCGPRSLEKPGGPPEQARKARAQRPPTRRSGGATGGRTTLGLQTKPGEGYPIASEASFNAKDGGGGLPPKALQPCNPTPVDRGGRSRERSWLSRRSSRRTRRVTRKTELVDTTSMRIHLCELVSSVLP